MESFHNDLYSRVQEMFGPALVTVIGSGASCGYGLPGMASLATHLRDWDPTEYLGEDDCVAWKQLVAQPRFVDDFEASLKDPTIPLQVRSAISRQIALRIRADESSAISTLLREGKDGTYARYFQRVLRTAKPVAEVITTNYDRLIEVALAAAEIRVDTMFYGHTIGRLDESKSRDELLSLSSTGKRGRKATKRQDHIRLSKPHGSLDWFVVDGKIVRSEIYLDTHTPAIVSPTGNKYRETHELWFQRHESRMNTAISKSQSMIFVGFGFNDEHLQHAISEVRERIPILVLSLGLTQNALAFIGQSPNVIGIEQNPDSEGSLVRWGSRETTAVPEDLWTLEGILKHILD